MKINKFIVHNIINFFANINNSSKATNQSISYSGCPIVLICDNNYVLGATVTITSLIENKNQLTEYKIFVLGVDLTGENKEKLRNIHKCIEIIELDNKYNSIAACHSFVTKAALYKFDIAQIFDNYKKALYIDVDTIIQGDLIELMEIDLNDNYAGAVKDMFAIVVNGDNKPLDLSAYFNSGVLLLNLELLRKDKINTKLLEYKKNNLDERYMDQNALNFVFGERVLPLHPKYNYMLLNTLFNEKSISSFFGLEEKIEPLIIHYIYRKPWKYNGVESLNIWDKYLKIALPKEYNKIVKNRKIHPDFWAKMKKLTYLLPNKKIRKSLRSKIKKREDL